MRYDSCQFGSFDGLDNRKTIHRCFVLMGRGLTDHEAGMRRAGFLQGLLTGSTNGFADKPMFTTPLSAAEAYNGFVALTGVLGVPIYNAAKLLEDFTRELIS